MLQSTVNDILVLIDTYNTSNKVRIGNIQTKADLLSAVQNTNHKEIQKSAKKGLSVNLDQFELSDKVFESTNGLYNKLEEINREELTWINLAIKFSKYAEEVGHQINTSNNQIKLDIERKIQLLGLMVVELEKEEEFEYCAFLMTKYNKLQKELKLELA